MEVLPKLERVRWIPLTPGMKLIVMSDMHRGDGSGADDFAQNASMVLFMESIPASKDVLTVSFSMFKADLVRKEKSIFMPVKAPPSSSWISRAICVRSSSRTSRRRPARARICSWENP